MKHSWQSPDSDALFAAILKLKNVGECERFFRDLCTLKELEELVMRFKIAGLLHEDKQSYLQIAEEVGTSTATITRVAHWLHSGENGYKLILNRTQ